MRPVRGAVGVMIVVGCLLCVLHPVFQMQKEMVECLDLKENKVKLTSLELKFDS
jgi:hypothetical protein